MRELIEFYRLVKISSDFSGVFFCYYIDIKFVEKLSVFKLIILPDSLKNNLTFRIYYPTLTIFMIIIIITLKFISIFPLKESFPFFFTIFKPSKILTYLINESSLTTELLIKKSPLIYCLRIFI